MDIIVDTSAIIAVLLGEPERDAILRETQGRSCIAPGSLAWEVGNALTAMLKRRSLTQDEAVAAMASYGKMSLSYVEIDLPQAVHLASELKIYAYDAYMIQCARQHQTPLLTLDRPMMMHADRLKLTTIKVMS